MKGSLVICFLLNIGSRLVMASTTSRCDGASVAPCKALPPRAAPVDACNAPPGGALAPPHYATLAAGYFHTTWPCVLSAYAAALHRAASRQQQEGMQVTGCGMQQLASRTTRPGRRPCRVLLLVMLLGPNTIAGALGVPVMTIGEGGAAVLLITG